jgi:uncharacterized protein YcbK (DUF882 family)
MPERKQLTRNFNLAEFHTHDGTEVPERYEAAVERLCRLVLEPMRRLYGPCRVVSGYRHRAYNARIGGARQSYHIYDDHHPTEVAADITFRRGNPTLWRATANTLLLARYRRRGGLGRYIRGNFLHVDTRRGAGGRWEGP